MNSTPFVSAARRQLSTLPKRSEEALILDFFLNNALGRLSAKPWNTIQAFLDANGVSMSQQRFQQGILKSTREGDIFIASNDHGASRGYFLIETQADAAIMCDWYEKRIQREQAHLDHLKALATRMSWTL